MQAGTLRAEPGPIQRHNHSRSFHDTHHNASNSTPRRGSYAKPETQSHSNAVPSVNAAVTPGGTAAALKAAQLSSAQYAHVPVKQIATPSPVKPIRNPYMAAASKAWSNSTAKLASSSAPVSRSASAATVPVFIAVQQHVETAPLPSKSPALIASRRVSLELRAESAEEVAPALAPSQQPQSMPALQPSVFLHPNQVGVPLRGRPSRSQSSDRSVRARSQSAFEGRRSVSHTAHEPLPSSAGSLLAARISFAQDRAMHESSADGYFGPQSLSPPPPIRSPSANRNRVASGQSSLYAHYTQNKSTSSLPPPPDRPVQTASPGLTVNNAGNTRLSVDGGRAALMAASLSFAHHEQENPRSATPKAEPYAYVTPSQRITLRKEPSNSAKHLAKFLKHGRVQPIPPQDRKRYEGLWAANKGLLLEEAPRFSEEVVNIIVRDIWSRSRLQDEILAQVWQLVDRAGTGRLSKDEFVVGTWLIDHRLRGRKLPNRHELTDDIFAPGPMTRLGIKMPRKLKHDTAKYLDPSVSRKSEKKAQKDAAKKLKREKRARLKQTVA